MQKKGRRNKPQPAWVVVFLIFAAFAVWLFYINQPFAGIIFIFMCFLFLKRAFSN